MSFDATQALTAAATVAGRAPSIHNTQPWRFVVDGPVLELHTEPSRWLTELDPDGHMMLVSCGAAVHHASVALAADGWRTEIDRPAGMDGDLLARIRVTGRGEADPVAVRRLLSRSRPTRWLRWSRRSSPPTGTRTCWAASRWWSWPWRWRRRCTPRTPTTGSVPSCPGGSVVCGPAERVCRARRSRPRRRRRRCRPAT